MRCPLLLVWLTLSWATVWFVPLASGQATTTLTGRITDSATGKPLTSANVYLNGTTQGAVTDAQGYFVLSNVPLGTVEVVASFLGYQTQRQTQRLDDGQPKTTNFRLTPDDRTLGGVTVKARRRDKPWEKQLRQFKRDLLGQPYGGQCLITNSYVLSFTEADGHLRATATEPLIIENQALGYRLWYDLQHFDAYYQHVYYAGSTRFEELPATDERQASRYRRNRMTAYIGSIRHLMTSLADSTYEQEGFLVYQEDLTMPITPVGTPATLQAAINNRLLPPKLTDLLQPGKLKFERRLVSNRQLVVFYTKASSSYSPYVDARFAYSQLLLPNRQMQFTTDGWITSPNGMELHGSLADDRLSTLLPADWKPGNSSADPAPTLAVGKLLPLDARMSRIRDDFTNRFRNPAPGIFLQIDKPVYVTGDRLWLSAYLFDGPTHRLPVGETALQVDLLTPAGQLVQHQWLHVINGRAVGDFRLSDSLAAGTYRLRAYTDEDDGHYRPAFERPVALYNLQQARPSTVAAVDTAQKSLDVQLLPEGGRWVAGLPARLGVKVTGTDGRGRAVSGRIVDSTGAEVVRFTSNRLGMGSVRMTPQPGRSYRAQLLGTGHNELVTLPPVEPRGLVLSADVVSDSTRLIIQIAGTGSSAIDPVYVLIQQREQPVSGQKIQLQQGLARLTLPVATLPPGLNRITLYDGTAQPQAERLVFIPERLPPVRVLMTANKPRYLPREPVVLTLGLNDDGQAAVATLSASVTDAEQTPDDTAAATVHTHLLLTDELRGRVDEPNVYLKDNIPETHRALDDLLLTQGWRRVSGTPDTDLLGGVSVTGRILNAQNEPLPGAQIILASTAPGRAFVRSAGADEQGRFRLAGLPIADTTQLMAQLTDREFKDIPAKKAQITLERVGGRWEPDRLNRPPNWAALRAQLEAAKIRQEANPDLYRDRLVKVLKEVTVRARKREERPDDIQRRSLHGVADATVIFDETANQFANLYEMIRGRLAGVSVVQTQGGYRVQVRGPGSIQTNTPPLFLMDGIPILDETILSSFSPANIERVELLKNGGTAGIYGARGGSGVIAFYTKSWRSGQADQKPKAGTMPLSVIGFPSVQREFYVPRYEGQPDEASRIDRRDVLYWKPLIQTDAGGQTQLTFPLSDVVRTLRVTVQGITADGRPVVGVKLIRVQ